MIVAAASAAVALRRREPDWVGGKRRVELRDEKKVSQNSKLDQRVSRIDQRCEVGVGVILEGAERASSRICCHAMLAPRCQARRGQAMQCHAMPCHALRCSAMPCDALRCPAMPCDALRCHPSPPPCCASPSQQPRCLNRKANTSRRAAAAAAGPAARRPPLFCFDRGPKRLCDASNLHRDTALLLCYFHGPRSRAYRPRRR